MAEIVVKLVNGELAGKTAQSIAKEVNAAAQALKKAEVGTEAWVKANKKLEETKQLQADLKKQIEGTTEASDFLKKSWNALPGAQYFNQIGQSFGFMKKGVGGLISQFGMLKVAIASTGIGVLVLLLSSLISYFTSTQEGIDKVTAVTRPMKAIFEALIGVLQNLGGKVFKQLEAAIKNPTQAFKDLGDMIVNNVINRFKAFALLGPAIQKIFSKDWKEGLKDLANAGLQAVSGVENVIDKIVDGAKQIGKVIDEAAEKGKRLDQLQKSIELAELANIVRSKQLELLLKQQKDLVEDSTKSWDERRAAGERALAIQQTMLNNELSLLDKRIEKMKIEQSLNDTSRDQQKELAELEAKKLELQAKVTEQSIEFKKKLAEFDKAQAAEEKAVLDNIAQLKAQAAEDGFQQELAQIQQQTEQKIEALKGTEAQILEQKLLLQEIEAQQVLAVVDKYAKEAADKKQAELDKKTAAEKKASDDAIANAKREALEKEAVEQAYRDFASGALGDLINSLGEDEKARKKNATAIKAFTKAKIFIDLQSEIAGLNASPGSTFTLGVAGGLKAALAIIRAGFAIQKVNQQQFKFGGIPSGVLRGPSHAQGGIPLVAEGEEIILTKGVYRDPRLRSMASQLNVAAGGRSFALGGVPVNPMDRSRGAMPSSASQQGFNSFIDYEAMARANSNMMDEKIARIKVQNVVTETRDAINVVNQIQDEADV